jgi:general stress protein YciG
MAEDDTQQTGSAVGETPRPSSRAATNRGNFANDRARAAEAGRLGGQRSHGGGGAAHNRGNFAQNRQRASEAGRKGGQHSHGGHHTH